MEISSIEISGKSIKCLDKFNASNVVVTIIRIFELNGKNYISFVEESNKILKTLIVSKFESKFKIFINSLIPYVASSDSEESTCGCNNCKEE